MTRILAVSIAVLLATPPLAVAQGIAPTLTVAGQAETFAPAVFLLAPGPRVSALFAKTPLPPDVEASARASGSWERVALGVAPAVIVDFEYTPGSTSGLVGELKRCRLTAVGFKSKWQVSGTGAQCHIVSVGGLLKSGGGIAGLMEGKGQGYALRLPFAGALMEASTAVATTAAPAAAAAAPASPAIPLNTVTGTGTYQGQKVTVTHALAWWAPGQNQVRLSLYDHAPKPGTLAKAREGDSSDDPSIVDVYLGFDGAARTLDAVDYCYVNVTFPKGGPLGVNTKAQGCGLTSLTTDGRPGGAVLAVLKGTAPGPSGSYSWDLSFHVPIAK